MTTNDIAVAVSRIRAEFVEMPGMSLTPAQVARLVGADWQVVGQALGELEARGFLARTRHGRFVRVATTLQREPFGDAGMIGS